MAYGLMEFGLLFLDTMRYLSFKLRLTLVRNYVVEFNMSEALNSSVIRNFIQTEVAVLKR